MIQRIPDDMSDKDKNQGQIQDKNQNDDSASDSEPHERTTMQQEKAVNKKKQDKREAGLQSARSRSSSRRARRQRLEKGQKDGKYLHTTSLEALEEADANGDLQQMGKCSSALDPTARPWTAPSRTRAR